MTTLWAGATTRFYTDKAFTSIAGTAVTPDVVTFTWSVQGSAPVTYTWTNGNTPPDPSLKIVNDGTGLFHVDLPTTGLAGTWTTKWTGAPGISGLDTTKTSAVVEWDSVISATAL